MADESMIDDRTLGVKPPESAARWTGRRLLRRSLRVFRGLDGLIFRS
jgi:hypothetical protein